MSVLKMTIDSSNRISKINKEIYGHFSEHLGRCIYGGIYVGEDSPIPNVRGIRTDVVEAFKAIKVPVVRWPGGCFADTYHWMDGIGPKESRKKIVNTNWGGVTEDNSFGTHEFLDFCEQVGCEAYVSVNVGSGTVQEAHDWVEYMTSSNDSPMTELAQAQRQTGALEGKVYRHWQRKLGLRRLHVKGILFRPLQTVPAVYRLGLAKDSLRSQLERLRLDRHHDAQVQPWHDAGLVAPPLHHPNRQLAAQGLIVDFDKKEYYDTLSRTWYMERILRDQKGVMQRYDDEKRIGLCVDEWGIWTDVMEGTNPGFLYQQNSMRDAILASINLNLFNLNSDRVKMANIAQIVNVLQAIVLTEGEKMVLTPTYHVFDMFKEHMEATLVYSNIENKQLVEGEYLPAVSQSVSVDDEGRMHITISNASLDEDFEIDCAMPRTGFKSATTRVLTAEYNKCNTFEEPNAVAPKTCDCVKLDGEKLSFKLPKCSVVAIELC